MTYADDGKGADVAIGGLPFKLAISKDNPYERATAQFRKEQFDSSNTVGDQSLTGLWTRGQLSFHKGAGLTYYEVLDGAEVLNRYKDSDSLVVTKPGKASLIPSLVDQALAATDAVPAPLSKGGGIYALTSAGVKYTTGGATTTIATSDAAIPTSITSSGSLYYVTNGTKIERQYDASVGRTNHVTNPSFEAATTGWTGARALSTSASYSKYGTRSMYVNAGAQATNYAQTTLSGLTVGTTYVVSGWVWCPDTYGLSNYSTDTVAMSIDGMVVDTSSATRGTWLRVSGTWAATTATPVLKFDSVGASSYATSFYLDSVMVTESPYTNDYFDGSQPGCTWAGTPNASKSLWATSSNGASAALITLSGGATWLKAWWAKGRIFAVDSAGYWYALPAATATVSNVDAFWNSGKTGVNWSLAQGTGPVYISDGFDVYTITVDTTGVVPSITTPTTAARMPLGEEIACLSYYLGYLTIPTTRGVRTALTQAEEVFLGPLVIEGDFSATKRIGSYDTRVYVAGRPDGRSGSTVLCALDLSQQVNDLVPAWSPHATVSALSSSASGAMVDATGKLYTWAAGSLLAASRDELASTGYVTTGFHRFGTLEPKSFKTLLPRVGGTGGTVQVYRVDADGTETAIGSPITAPATAAADIPIGLTDPAEMVGLKFVLTRSATDPTKGPELLGYQLRALPAPKRQRMIRMPLMLQDIERRGGAPAKGYVGSAWDRLSALETMEASGTTVTLQDFRTGETGEVFVETVEHRGVTPPGDNSNGFGGLVWVTLRKLS